MTAAKQNSDQCAGAFGQTVMAEYVLGGHLAGSLAAARGLYRRRAGLLLDALAAHMPPRGSWTRPGGGFFVWLTAPEHVDPAPGAAARRRALAPGRLHVHLLETRLAAFLDLPADLPPGALAAARDELARAARARPAGPYPAPPGRPVWKMARVDPLVDRLVGAGATAAEILERVQGFLADSAAGGAGAGKIAS